MNSVELIKALKKRRDEIKEELKALEALINVYSEKERAFSGSHVGFTKNIRIDTTPIAKGRNKWRDYALYLLGEIGGEARAAEVADLAVKANPKGKESTIRHAIIMKLSDLYNKDIIEARKPEGKREYIYKLKIDTVDTEENK